MSNCKENVEQTVEHSFCGRADDGVTNNTSPDSSLENTQVVEGNQELGHGTQFDVDVESEMNNREIVKANADQEGDREESSMVLDNSGFPCATETSGIRSENLNVSDCSCREQQNGNTTKQNFDFSLLPHVVILNILSYLDIKNRGNAACVSKQLLSSCRDPSLWRKLDLSGRRLVTDSVLNRLASISSHITYLDVSECMSSTEQGLQTALQNCRSLHTLRTIRCPSMTDSCLSTVGQMCPNLRVIVLSMCSITDNGVEMLCQGCTGLKEINLNQCRFITSTSLVHIATYCEQITLLTVEHNVKIHDDGVTVLVSKCRKLTRLQLNSCGISGQGVRSISLFCQNMKILDVRYCTTLNDDIVKEIVCGCPNLELLNVSLCFNVTDVSVGHITNHCTKLVSLYLVHCRITDEGLRILSVSGFGLERLDVSWCQDITDDGVKTLVVGCKTLQHLGLVRCDHVTNEVITELSLGYPTIFLSTFMTEVNRMFKKAGLPEAIPAPPL